MLVLSGCFGSSFNPVAPPSVHATGPQTFPAIPPSGGVIVLEPGTYTCPTVIPSGTHIVGHGAIVTPELSSDTFAPLSSAPAPVVRVLCNADLTIANVGDVDISGVVFDFQGAGGLVLDSINWSRFDIGIVNATTALTLESRTGNAAGNVFPRLLIYKANTGILVTGFGHATTWNDFGHVDIVRARDIGIDISQLTDTNTFDDVRIRVSAAAQAGVVFNDAGVLGDVDASGNIFRALSCDADNSSQFTGYCADFRGYTVGNKITMGFGIMPDGNKVHFANAFSQSANIVTQIQETPKQP
jgi:hypothetical protein